jgi:hypothetical protein
LCGLLLGEFGFAGCALCGGGGFGGGLGQGVVDGGVELGYVHDLSPAVGGEDDDGGGLVEADALAHGAVSLDFRGEAAAGVHDEGKLLFVVGEPLAGEGGEVVLAGDGLLSGEDVAAELVGEFGRDLVLEIARGDGGVLAPLVGLDEEVVAEEGDFVVLDGGVDDGCGVGAGGALEVFELDDGGFLAGRELEGRGVLEVSAGAGGTGDVLGVSGGGEREEGGGEHCGNDGGEAESAKDHRCKTHKGYERYFRRKLRAGWEIVRRWVCCGEKLVISQPGEGDGTLIV